MIWKKRDLEEIKEKWVENMNYQFNNLKVTIIILYPCKIVSLYLIVYKYNISLIRFEIIKFMEIVLSANMKMEKLNYY